MSICNYSCVVAFVAQNKLRDIFGDLPVVGSAEAV
jgi:predicted metal-binding protein